MIRNKEMDWNKENFSIWNKEPNCRIYINEMLYTLEKVGDYDFFVLNLTEYPMQEFHQKIMKGEIKYGSSEAPAFMTVSDMLEHLEKIGFPKVGKGYDGNPAYMFYGFKEMGVAIEVLEPKPDVKDLDEWLGAVLSYIETCDDAICLEITLEPQPKVHIFRPKTILYLKPVHNLLVSNEKVS